MDDVLEPMRKKTKLGWEEPPQGQTVLWAGARPPDVSKRKIKLLTREDWRPSYSGSNAGHDSTLRFSFFPNL